VLVYGINPVAEALRAQRVRRLRISARSDRRMDEIVALAAKAGVPIERVDRTSLDRVARDGLHQGVVADVHEGREYSIDDLAAAGDPPPLIVVLDGIEDPHNVGAILRTADAAGVTGIVRQSRHAAALDGVVGKASAGALALARIATVVNIARALEELKAANVWVAGAVAAGGSKAPWEIDLTVGIALVLGAEGKGIRPLVLRGCDLLVKIPMFGKVASLNVGAAGAMLLYEVVRQRSTKA